MSKLSAATAVSTLALVALTGCQAVVFGDGDVTTQDREVPAFRKVAIASGIVATLKPGARSVAIRTDANVQSVIETVVERNTLIVRVAEGTLVAKRKVLEATIFNDALEGLDASGGSPVDLVATPTASFPITASGGSHVEIAGLSCDDLAIDASGGSEVTVSGTAKRGSATASGASELHLREVPLETLALDASGGSRIEARVSSKVSGAVSGGSEVTVTGRPNSALGVTGGSEVRFSDE